MFRIFVLALAAVILGLIVEQSRGCATARRARAEIQVAEESAIIVWDAASRLQHFIRRATFSTDTPDFGFLVPTPSQPALSESKDEAFSLLEKLTLPEVVTVRKYRLMPPIGCGLGSRDKSASVRVLDEQRVAGYDAVVLEADSAMELNAWLAKHGYILRPDLAAWLEPYVKAKWKITAFKIAKDATRPEIASSAVRMSFAADRPFFPYSEPAAQRDPDRYHAPRLLRVFFVADRRFDAKLDAAAPEWPGKTVWAGPLKEDVVQELAEKLTLAVGAPPVWMTVFEDRASPRPGTADVSFVPSASQEQVRRPPIINTEYVDVGGWICLGTAALLVLGPFIFKSWKRRRRARA